MSPLRESLRAVLTGHRSFTVAGVRYRERTTEPLHRALSGRGQGHKDYDVTFPDAAPLRIRCSNQRPYADITGTHVAAPYLLADPVLRPGMRVLDARCSTGFGVDHIVSLVGPSGAVVAFDPDHESIRYARRRYRLGNASFEIGGDSSLGGELDESFDAVVVVHGLRADDADSVRMAELWRVLAPGGPMLLVQPLPSAARQPDASEAGGPLQLSAPELRHRLDGLEPAPGIEPADTQEFAALIARKPVLDAETRRRKAREQGGPYPPMR